MKTIILFLLTAASYNNLLAETKRTTNSLNAWDWTIPMETNKSTISDLNGFKNDFGTGSILAPPLLTPDWNSLGQGIETSVMTMTVHNGDLYVGGCFDGVSGASNANYLARWDGCSWYGVTSGLDGCVNAMVFVGNDLYLGGNFTGHVAKWNGTSLTFLDGINQEVLAIAVNGNNVYAGGYFTNASGQADADGIARWNGSSWNAMGSGITVTLPFLEIVTTTNDVYVGGDFINAGGVSNADYIARWDGSNWYALGSGLNNFVTTIQISGPDVYVCGAFTDAGGNPITDRIARWNGTSWNNVCLVQGGGYMFSSMLLTSSFIYVCATTWDCYYAELVRYNLQTDEWEYFSYPYWTQCAVDFNTILEIGSDLYCSWGDGFGGVVRWGEPGPSIEITGVPFSICQDAAPISLPTTQSGFTGTWSGPGVTNNVFNPASQYGYTLLTFTPNPGQCVPVTYWEIDVFLHYLEYGFSPTFCESEPPIPLSQYQFGVLGTWSGTGVINNFFDPAGLLGSYELTFTPNAGQCYAIAMLYVQVELTAIPNIFGVPETICENGSSIALPVVQSGIEGNWSGQGVNNNTFDPSGLNGPITLTFTPDPEFCATQNTFDIQVNPEIVITINGVPATLCQLSPSISLPTTQSGVPGNWSGPGVVNNSFLPANQIGNVTLTFSPIPTQCAVPVNSSILVFINIPVITGIPVSVCESNPPIALLTNFNGIDGNWSGQGVTNNTFNPAGLSGNVSLMFNPLAGECANVALQIIQVDPLITPVLSDIPFSMCSLDDPILLSENQGGFTGDWSGPGVYNNVFDPVDLNGDILLTFTPNAGQCADTADAIITVQAANPPVITGIPSSVCVLAAPVVLPTAQQGISGNWSGQGVVNNMFNPNGLNGEIPLLFSPLFGQCAVSSSTAITVYTSFTPAITGIPNAVCENAAPQNLVTVQNGVSGNWSGPGVVNNIFNPAGQDESATLLFTPLPMQCATSTTWMITIDTVEVPDIIDFPTAVCESDLPIALDTVQSGISGNWNGLGIVNDTFNPVGLMGIVQVTFSPNADQCALPASTDILVNVHVHPVLFDLPDSVCQAADPLPLSPIQNGIEGTWYGQGIANDTFSPGEQVGMVTLSFVPDNGPCEDTVTTQLFVNAPPSINNLQVACDSVGNTYVVSFDIAGGDTTSYMVDGTLLGTTSFTSSPIPFTHSEYSFTLDDAVGCGPVPVTGFNVCLCSTYAGTMNVGNTPLRVCIGPRFTVGYNNDAHLDPDDVIGFVLHDQSGSVLGHVFSMSSQAVFSYVPGMVLGQTYFISVVAGTNNGSGSINLSDPCLSVSPGVPVIFYACDPKEDDQNAEVADHSGRPEPIPFDDGIERSQLASEEPGNSSNEITYLLPDDPDGIIKTLRVYDLLGRLIYTKENIPFAEYNAMPEKIKDDLVAGYYVEVFEVENGDGKVAIVSRRFTAIGD
jgi:hypothetical protein